MMSYAEGNFFVSLSGLKKKKRKKKSLAGNSHYLTSSCVHHTGSSKLFEGLSPGSDPFVSNRVWNR